MRPDDDRLVPFEAGGSDPALRDLIDALAAAGERFRTTPAGRGGDAPSGAWASALRERLVGPASGAAVPPVASSPVAAARVVPTIAARPSSVVRIPRWAAAGLAAVLIVALVGLGVDRGLPTVPASRAADVAAATLVRDGVATALGAGDALAVGDVVRTAAEGRATLVLGASQARLAGGVEIAIVTLDARAISLDQRTGRVYHRVDLAAGTTYQVTTADVSWTATGTAFDIDRVPGPAGTGDRARLVAVEHATTVAGPGLSAVIDEGRAAVVDLGSRTDGAVHDVGIGRLTSTDLRDPWLLRNARRDAALGFALGVFSGVDLAVASPTPSGSSATPSASPTDVQPSPDPSPAATATLTPTATPTVTASPTPKPTPEPTPKPTRKPTPKPTATPTPAPTESPEPDLAAMTLTATGCDGRFAVLSWSKSSDPRFNHYQSLRSTSMTIPATYPPVAPAVAPDGLYAPLKTTLIGVDAGLTAGQTVHYRTIAFDADDVAYAASPVTSVTPKAVKDLAAPAAVAEGPSTRISWAAYGGPGACFEYYKLVWSGSSSDPSYFGAHDGAIAIGEQAATTKVIDGLAPGTYWFRVETIRSSSSGSLLVARTAVVEYVVP